MQIRDHIQPAELQITRLTIPPSHSYNQQTDDWCELYYCRFPVMCLWCPTDIMLIAFCSVILNSVLYVGFLDYRTKRDHLVMRSHQPLHLISLYFAVDMTRENKIREHDQRKQGDCTRFVHGAQPSSHGQLLVWTYTFCLSISSNAHKHDTAHPFHKLASLVSCFQHNTHRLWSHHNMVWVDGNDWNLDTMI